MHLPLEHVSLEKFKKGDPIEFEKIYDESYNILLSYCSHFIKDVRDAEEIISDALVKLKEYRYTIKNLSHLQAWLLKVIKNACLDLIRRENRMKDIRLPLDEEEYGDVADPYTDTVLIYEECWKILSLNTDRLTPDQREILQWKYQGLSNIEIAKIRGVTPNAINNQMARIRERVVELLRSGGVLLLLLTLRGIGIYF